MGKTKKMLATIVASIFAIVTLVPAAGAVATQLPDVSVTDVYLTESTNYLTVDVSNLGDADVDTTATGSLEIWIDGVQEWAYSWSTWSDQSFRTVGGTTSVQSQALEGAHEVVACLYPGTDVGDSDSTNDCMTVTLGGTTDPAVADVYLDGSLLTVDITNEGTIDLTDDATGSLEIWIDSVQEWTYSWSTWSDQDFRTVGGISEIQSQALEGAHEVMACLYPGTDTEDVDSSNNCMTVTLGEEEGTTDPSVQNVYLTGNALTIDVTNEGTADLADDASGSLYIWINDTLEWTYSWSTWSDQDFRTAGGVSEIQPQSLTGQNEVKACVYPSTTVEDADTTNNCVTATLGEAETETTPETTEGSADPYVNDIYLTSTNSYLTVEVGNMGTEDIADDATGHLYIWIDDTLEWTYSWKYWADQDFRAVNGISEIQPQKLEGAHTVKACVYPGSDTADTDSSNNCVTETFEEEVSDTEEYDYSVGISVGTESDYTNFFMQVCADADTDKSKSFDINFNANGYDNTLGVTGPINGQCKTFYSWGMHNFGLEDDVEYTVTATVDYNDEVSETDETNNEETFTVTIPSNETGVTTDNLLFRPFLLLMRIGDVDGHDEDDIHDYTGSLLTSNSSSVGIEAIGSILFDDHPEVDADTYTDTGYGAEFDVRLYNHWDGIIFYIYPENLDAATERSLQLTVDGHLDETIANKDDLGVYEIGDGTDNIVQLRFLGFLDNVAEEEEEVETMAKNVEAVAALLSELGSSLEEEDHPESFFDIWDDIIDGIFEDTAVFGSDTAVASIEDLLNENLSDGLDIDKIESALADYEDKEDEIEYALYEDGINPFKDVPSKEWYWEFVKNIEAEGIISGYKDEYGNSLGEFRPGNEVTVAEILKIALEAANQGKSSKLATLGNASDHWAEGYVAKAEELGLTIVKDETLDLNRPATRAEVIEILFEALGMNVPEYNASSFVDAEYAGDYLSVVEYAKDLGIIQGYDSGKFGYGWNINRAEIAKIIVNILEVSGSGQAEDVPMED